MSEPLDGGQSFIESWTAVGGPGPNVRTTTWASGLRVQAIASTGGTTAIAGLVQAASTSTLQLEFVNPTMNFSSVSTQALESSQFPGRVARLRGLSSTGVAPMVVLTDGESGVGYRVKVRRFDSSSLTFGQQLFETNMTGSAFGDDVVELPSGNLMSGWLMVAGRANGAPAYASSPGSNSNLVVMPRLAWSSFPLITAAINSAPPGGIVDLFTGSTPNFTGPIRVSFDGTTFLFVAGQAGMGNTLRVERYTYPTFTLDSALASSGPMTVVDLIRGPTGVLLLGSIDGPSTFGGVTIPWLANTGSNVVVIAMNANQITSVRTWNLPGHQRPVAFEHAAGTLAILVHEGPNASLWRTPVP